MEYMALRTKKGRTTMEMVLRAELRRERQKRMEAEELQRVYGTMASVGGVIMIFLTWLLVYVA